MVVIRNPAELASALRVSLTVATNATRWPPLTMPKPALAASNNKVATTPERRGRRLSIKAISPAAVHRGRYGVIWIWREAKQDAAARAEPQPRQ